MLEPVPNDYFRARIAQPFSDTPAYPVRAARDDRHSTLKIVTDWHVPALQQRQSEQEYCAEGNCRHHSATLRVMVQNDRAGEASYRAEGFRQWNALSP